MTETKTKTRLSQKLDEVPKGKFQDVVKRLGELGIDPKNLRRHAKRGNNNRGETLLKFATALGCELKEIIDPIDLVKR